MDLNGLNLRKSDFKKDIQTMSEYIFSSESIEIQSSRSFHPNEQTLLSEGL